MRLEKFIRLGLSESSINEINRKGFEEPTEIQEKVIPIILNGETDVIAQARTGTGKTAAFGLPVIEKIEEKAGHVQALVLVPTRELALQVSEELNSFRGSKKISIIPVYGGQSMPEQIRRLKKGIDIVVGTPGRILDHLKRKTLNLDRIRFTVLDEADEMLNMGFIQEVEEILSHTRSDKRTLLFSATMPDEILNVAEKYMNEYEIVKSVRDKLTVDLTDQVSFEVKKSDRFEALCRIIDIEDEFYGLIFCRTKVDVDELTGKLLDRGYDAEGIHGDFSQNHRERSLEKFRKKRVNILIATDVAARGIDISEISHVINYSLPQDPESYVHRIGRTGRAGKKGVAITFISSSERRKLSSIAKATNSAIRKEKLPNITDIIDARKNRISADLNTIIEEGSHFPYYKTAQKMLDVNDPVDLLAALLKYSFNSQLDEKNYSEIREIKAENRNTTRLFVSRGKKDGMTPKKLVKLIQNESRINAASITDITVKDSFSFITVPNNEADMIIKDFSKRKKGNNPDIQKANKMKSGKKKRAS
jgi:ATP-dependent RNA helicase DeaD